MLLHSLTNFEIKRYYQNEPRFNGVFSKDNLPKKIKHGAYIINLHSMQVLVRTGLLYFVKKSETFYLDSFGVEHVPEEIKEFIGNKNTKANIFRVQSNNSIISGYSCIGFFHFMLAGKTLTDFTSLFSPYDVEENGSIIFDYFQDE